MNEFLYTKKCSGKELNPDIGEQTDAIPFSHRNFCCNAQKELLSTKESKVDAKSSAPILVSSWT